MREGGCAQRGEAILTFDRVGGVLFAEAQREPDVAVHVLLSLAGQVMQSSFLEADHGIGLLGHRPAELDGLLGHRLDELGHHRHTLAGTDGRARPRTPPRRLGGVAPDRQVAQGVDGVLFEETLLVAQLLGVPAVFDGQPVPCRNAGYVGASGVLRGGRRAAAGWRARVAAVGVVGVGAG
jgi:hypothetical protein